MPHAWHKLGLLTTRTCQMGHSAFGPHQDIGTDKHTKGRDKRTVDQFDKRAPTDWQYILPMQGLPFLRAIAAVQAFAHDINNNMPHAAGTQCLPKNALVLSIGQHALGQFIKLAPRQQISAPDMQSDFQCMRWTGRILRWKLIAKVRIHS